MKSSYLATLNKEYIQTKNGDVFKVMQDHFLKMSPTPYGEDRRIFEISNEDITMLTCENACMIVNRQFAEQDERWERNGKKYLASSTINKDIDEHTYLLSTLPNHSIVKKAKQYLSSVPNNQTISIESENGLTELKMVKHKGKIYYILIINEFLPRVKMYDTFGKFCQWANIKNCKPIFNLTDKKYI